MMRSQSLLRSGVLVGPLYLLVSLAQALTRQGFDLARHPLSLLANGPGGWVQTMNFIVCGLLVIAAAAGFRRALGSRATSLFLSVFGAGMLVAAIFPADPVDGFPPGTPAGYPTSISTAGIIHFVAGTLGFTALAVSCFFAAAALRRRNATALAAFSLLSGLAVLFGFFGGAMLGPAGIAGIWISVLVGWAWLATVSLHLYRTARG
jgi:hypothetical membrane protein